MNICPPSIHNILLPTFVIVYMVVLTFFLIHITAIFHHFSEKMAIFVLLYVIFVSNMIANLFLLFVNIYIQVLVEAEILIYAKKPELVDVSPDENVWIDRILIFAFIQIRPLMGPPVEIL
ncbi:hypothetical protein ACJX0J_011699, partial [Zea mays]